MPFPKAQASLQNFSSHYLFCAEWQPEKMGTPILKSLVRLDRGTEPRPTDCEAKSLNNSPLRRLIGPIKLLFFPINQPTFFRVQVIGVLHNYCSIFWKRPHF